MKPIIGVTPLYDDKCGNMWMLDEYVKLVKSCGGIPIILPLYSNINEIQQLYNLCNGILLTGGHDLDPSLYNEMKSKTCQNSNMHRDYLERELFTMAYKDDKPVLGIGRGMQLINVVMGGSLYQDIADECENVRNHSMKPPYDRVHHIINIDETSPLYKILEATELGVNSYHHQAVKKIGNGLREMAQTGDGIIEGLYAKDKSFIMGVQWHPELLYRVSPEQIKIVSEFIKQSEKKI